jgi:hypothetical protein
VAVLNRLIAVLLGLALIAAGVILLLETALAGVNRPPLLIDRSLADSRLSELSWTDPEVDIALVALVALGALLLLVQLLPRQPYALPLRGDQGRQGEIERKPLAALLAARAERDSDVVRAQARVSRRKAQLRAWAVPGADIDAIRERLGQHVDKSLNAFQLARPLRTRVAVIQTRERTP